jgi:L-lactate permease
MSSLLTHPIVISIASAYLLAVTIFATVYVHNEKSGKAPSAKAQNALYGLSIAGIIVAAIVFIYEILKATGQGARIPYLGRAMFS